MDIFDQIIVSEVNSNISDEEGVVYGIKIYRMELYRRPGAECLP